MTTRRALLAISPAILAALAFAGGAGALGLETPMHTGQPDDFDFLVGSWRVAHERLNGRLVGSTDWSRFEGACTMWKLMDGMGNVDDNWLDLPGGAYRAVGLRAFNPETRQWAIWWLDGRDPHAIETPVRGGFEDGVGTFIAHETLNNQPILVRFRWSETNTDTPRWEQAFSADDGATWETNWRMRFTRA